MRIRYIIMFGVAVFLSSCTTVRKTSDSAAVDVHVSTYPTIADLHIGPQRVSKTTKWKWNPFNTTSLSDRRGNVKAELIKEAGADILVEPEFIQQTSWGNLLGGSLTVTGYPATLDNFRKATPEDIEAMRCAGKLGCDERYIVLGQDNVNGTIIGVTEPSVLSPAADTNTSSNVLPAKADVASVAVAPKEEHVIPNDHVSLAPQTSKKATLVPRSTQSAYLAPSTNNVLAFDEIGKTRYLTTMAREYYGNPDFWPYIYQENDFGHPDRIKPGTTVVIPNLKKFGVNPRNQADIDKAKRLAREIYARYGKDI